MTIRGPRTRRTNALRDGVRAYLALDAGVIADPYPLFTALRERDPEFWSDDLPGWLVTGYGSCLTVLRSPMVSSRRHLAGRSPLSSNDQARYVPLLSHLSSMMGSSDPPAHTRLRALANKAFTPREVAGMRSLIQVAVDDLIGSASARGAMDVVSDFAYPLPITIISELMGVASRDRSRVKAWSDDFIRFVSAPYPSPEIADQAQASLEAMGRYFEPLIAERQDADGSDLLARLAHASEDQDRLSHEELLAMCNSLFAGGHETTTNLIANAVLALARTPDAWQRLVSGDVLVETAVEELLRYDTSVQRLERFAMTDFELAGHEIHEGDRIWLLLGAANRDPTAFDAPDRLVLDRTPNRHLTFAHGPHYCIGAPLARLELQVAFDGLRRLGEIELLPGPIEWHPMLAHRGPRALRIRFRGRPRQRDGHAVPARP